MTFAVQAKAIKDLGKLCISELQSRLVIVTSPARCEKLRQLWDAIESGKQVAIVRYL